MPTGERFQWDEESTYIRNPPFFEGITPEPLPPADITGARVLALLGDSVTTDHISPAGSIPPDSPAGKYLISKGVQPRDFNSYGARRGNHEVMMRGTFANIRLRNQLAPGTEGGWTTLLPDGEVTTIYDASVKYRDRSVPPGPDGRHPSTGELENVKHSGARDGASPVCTEGDKGNPPSRPALRLQPATVRYSPRCARTNT